MGQMNEGERSMTSPEENESGRQVEPPPPGYSAEQTPMFTQPSVQQAASIPLRLVPLDQLRDVPAPAQCLYCGFQGTTRIEYIAGRRTKRSARRLFLFSTFLAPLPYLTNGTKDVRHFCLNCGAFLALWMNGKNSLGHTQVVDYQNQGPM
ncbi:hypothetical protein RBB50_011375 [Rhinocladiella similis]